MSTAPTFQTVIENIAGVNTKRIGLTATPGRHHVNSDDSATQTLSEFYGHELIEMVDNDGKTTEDPIEFLQNERVLSRVVMKTIDGFSSKICGQDFTNSSWSIGFKSGFGKYLDFTNLIDDTDENFLIINPDTIWKDN